MESSLGLFGDQRLQKGGPFCTRGWLKWDAGVWRFGGLVGIGPAKFG
jgi:hypothetical protein